VTRWLQQVAAAPPLLHVCNRWFVQRRCKAEELVMVGDRYMTDVVFGNRLGMMTIRPAPLTWDGEPSTVKMVTCTCSKFSLLHGTSTVHDCYSWHIHCA
jgi:predicted HAD superfamily phosphohydrolase YqeG